MNLSLIAHDPADGTVRVYQLSLAAIVERTGRTDTFDRHEVTVRQVAGRDFLDGSVGAALAEVLGLDPSTFGEAAREQQQRLRSPGRVEPVDHPIAAPRTSGGSEVYDREPDPYDDRASGGEPW